MANMQSLFLRLRTHKARKAHFLFELKREPATEFFWRGCAPWRGQSIIWKGKLDVTPFFFFKLMSDGRLRARIVRRNSERGRPKGVLPETHSFIYSFRYEPSATDEKGEINIKKKSSFPPAVHRRSLSIRAYPLFVRFGMSEDFMVLPRGFTLVHSFGEWTPPAYTWKRCREVF